MRILPSRLVVISLLIAVSAAPLKATGYSFCNFTGQPIRAVGVAVINGTGQVDISDTGERKWFRLNIGECRVVWTSIKNTNSYYGYADGGGLSWGGEEMICVHNADKTYAKTAFDLDGESCGPIRLWIKFQKLANEVTSGPFQGPTLDKMIWPIGGLPGAAGPATLNLGPTRSTRREQAATPQPIAPPPPLVTNPPPQKPATSTSPSQPYIPPPCGCTKVFEGRCVGVCSGSCPPKSHCSQGEFGCFCRSDR